jgi:hypothetical protein
LIFSGINDFFFQNMAVLADVSDDQKGLGSVLAISSDVLAGNKAAPASAMQPGKKRTIFPLPL